MSKAISQREARQLRKRVAELETLIRQQRSQWSADYPGGAHLGTLQEAESPVWLLWMIYTARVLKHAVVVTTKDSTVRFYGLPQGEP